MLQPGMIVSAVPDLPLVIGLPFGLLAAMCAVSVGLWVILGRVNRP